MAKPHRMTPDEIKTHLEGPVMSIPTSFLADGAIDYDGVANIIETGIAGGTQVRTAHDWRQPVRLHARAGSGGHHALCRRAHGRTRDGRRRDGPVGHDAVS